MSAFQSSIGFISHHSIDEGKEVESRKRVTSISGVLLRHLWVMLPTRMKTLNCFFFFFYGNSCRMRSLTEGKLN